MRADDWIVDFLLKHGVTDVFGIPGVVVMDFLYAVDKRKPAITPHLNYHEQGAAFAACGYAQATGKLGVAYATRGPGFTNMLTAIADAYYDSVPVMFFTAHSTLELESDMRVLNNQEIDTVSFAKGITKKAVRIDRIDELQDKLVEAYKEATTGRKGPVFIDIYNALFSKDVSNMDVLEVLDELENDIVADYVKTVEESIKDSKRPVFLIGNGTRGGNHAELIEQIADKFAIPVLSSRGAQDIIPWSHRYYGFIGSRATRYSNFILSKSDLIIAIGNRLSFPKMSKSFLPVTEKAKMIRIDIDKSEFKRDIPNSIAFRLDSGHALSALLEADINYPGAADWIKVCDVLKEKLSRWDSNSVIRIIMEIIGNTDSEMPIVCDVGNHSFWVSTAYTYQDASNRIMYSGSFGTLGSALPKAIGAYYSTGKPCVCFTGDQGIQFNIQELQYIVSHKVPITVVILNNSSSGMIMEREVAKYGEHLIHTTTDSGYSYPDFKKVAVCYGLEYCCIDRSDELQTLPAIDFSQPTLVEIMIDKDTALEPGLPVGKVCQDLSPELPRKLYEELERL